MRKLWAGMSVAIVVMAGGGAARAQMPVIDFGVLAQTVQQLQTAQAQLTQMQQIYGSLNKITNMNQIAGILNNPSVRQALPGDFASAEKALMGQGGSAASWQQQNQVFTPGGNAFYARELQRAQGANAGQMSVAQQMYDAVGQRRAGLQQLQDQIAQSGDPKTTLDLQVRIQIELVSAQNDILAVSALRMVQQAEAQVEEQRRREHSEQMTTDNITRLGGTVPTQ